MSEHKVYLGDGVYADYDGMIVLTAENGISVTATIYLEPEVIAALLRKLSEHFDHDKLMRACIGGGS